MFTWSFSPDQPPRGRWKRACLIVAVVGGAWPMLPEAQAQGSTDHLPGKTYVVRVSPFFDDHDTLAGEYRSTLEEELRHTQGMMDHIITHLYVAQAAVDGRWFLVYYDRDRQTKEEVMRDSDLLVWGLHGHDVQIMPIELLKSPISSLASATKRK